MKKPKLLPMILVMLITILFVLSCSKKDEEGNGGGPTGPEEPTDFAVFADGEFGAGIGYHWSS